MRRISFSVAVVALTVFILAGTRRPASRTTPNHAHEYRFGTVYARQLGGPPRMWSCDLAARTTRALPPGVDGEPSQHRHGGQRWFLTTRTLENGAYPDGRERREIFAVSERGEAVQLTHGSGIEPAPAIIRWPRHGRDGIISWIGRRWTDGKVVQGGIYVARMDWGGDDAPVGLMAEPLEPALELPLVEYSALEWSGQPAPDISSHDWSPDGRALVYDTFAHRLCIQDLENGSSRTIAEVPARDPVWSPGGDRIAFRVAEPFGAIATIRPDGGGMEYLLTTPNQQTLLDMPTYFASGGQLAYTVLSVSGRDDPGRPIDVDVYVSRADGSASYNATAGLMEQVIPAAWRAD